MLVLKMLTNLLFILQLLRCFWNAGGSCLYPGHRSNEVINFSDSILENNTYPALTVAKYFCESFPERSYFKESVCQHNDTWTWTWTGPSVNCSLFISNRCQRRAKWVNSTPLRTLLLNQTCITFQRGIHMSMLENFSDNCDIKVHQEHLTASDYSNFLTHELQSMCNNFRFPEDMNKDTRKILFAMIPKKTELSWYEKFTNFLKHASQQKPPQCMYLYCYLHPMESKIIIEKCDSDQLYWICKHGITSCGIPSQTMNSVMEYTGIYVNHTATYKCPLGYAMDSPAKRHCQSNGRWSGVPPICRLVNCGPPDLQENVSYVLQQGKTTYRSWLQHKCLVDGHNITNGSEYRMCQASGQWSEETAVCDVYDKEEQVLNDSSYSGLLPGEKDLLKVIVGTIAGITFFIILIMWLVLAALTCHNKRRKMDGYTSQK